MNKITATLLGLGLVASFSMNVLAQEPVNTQNLNPQDIIGKWDCKLDDAKLATKISSLDEYLADGSLISKGDVVMNFNDASVQYNITSKQKWVIDGDILKWENIDLLNFKTNNQKIEDLINYRSSMQAGTTGSAKITDLSKDKLVLQYLVDGLTDIAPAICTRNLK